LSADKTGLHVLDQHVALEFPASYPPAAMASAKWQATCRPLASVRRAGSPVLHSAWAYGQRLWKTQPSTGASAVGISPCREGEFRFRVAAGSGTGVAATNPLV